MSAEVYFSEVEGLGEHDNSTDISSEEESDKECGIQFSDVEGLGSLNGGRSFSSEDESDKECCIRFSDVDGIGGLSGDERSFSMSASDSEDMEIVYLEGGSSSNSHTDAMEMEHEGTINSNECSTSELSDDMETDDKEEKAVFGDPELVSLMESIYVKRSDENEGIMKILCTRCCQSDCTSTVSRREALDARTSFQNKTSYDQRCWVLQYLHTHCKCLDGRKQFYFTVGAASVCMEAWRLVHGIGRKRLWELRHLCQNGTKVPLPPNTHQIGKRKGAVHTAIAWMKDFAAKCGDKMPDSPRIHLPSCQSKNSVYNIMKVELSEINVEVCSKSHFLKLWREELSHFVIPSVNRFAKCDTCTTIKTRLEHCTDPKQRNQLHNAREKHLHQQRIEREKYYKHQRKAKANPEKYMSIITDGMDQKATAIPHFIQESKSTNGAWKLPTHITGGIVHGKGQHAFIDFKEYPHDPNLTIAVILRILQKYAPELPKVLYLQLDNCGRENKNRFVLAFLCLLVELEVFTKVKLSFLMVGHTHEDIDQFFSRISTRLSKTNVPTLDALLDVIPKSFNRGTTTAERLKPVYDSKEWLEACMEDISQHSRPHVFRIKKGTDGKAVISTKLWSSSSEWVFPTGSSHLLTHHPEGTPDILKPNFTKIELPRLKQNIAKMRPFLTSTAMDTWNLTLQQLQLEERGEADLDCHWPFVDLLLPEPEKELCLQLSGTSSSSESEEEEENPCQIYIGKKRRHPRCALPTPGNMMAFYLAEYHQEWPQIGRVQNTKEGELHVHWYTGTITSQWKPLSITNEAGEQPWVEWIPESAAVTAPFQLTRTSRLSGEMQGELKELRDKYMA